MVLSLSVRILAVTLVLCSPIVCAAETVLLDFNSPTCGPCQQMRPVVQRLANDGFRVQEIDISRDPQTATRLGVTQVPTFLVMVDGQPQQRVVGPTTYDQLRQLMLRATPAPAPRQPARTLGQSPQSPTTFASQPTGVAPVANYDSLPVAAQDLATPQAGRVVALQDPNPRPARPAATANPFGNTPNRLPAAPAGSPNSLTRNPLHSQLLAATVKLTVEDAEGKSAGTGTIVDARSGEALVLTCGHIFRSSGGKGPITITTFQANADGLVPAATYSGHLIDYDLERDLALVSMRPSSPVVAAPIAGTNMQPLTPNVPVTSVGCNHGQNPTAIDSQVTALNRYIGTPNVEVAGAPVEGRSGGGLFNAQGQLVGVCYAAEPQGNEGLYVALPAIYAKLDSLNLSMIYRQELAPAQVAQSKVAQPPLPDTRRPTPAPQPLAVRGQEPEPAVRPQTATLPPVEQAALEEIQRRGTNSEVICIIRPQDPTAKSEVITLNNASPAFVQALANPQRETATAAAGQLLR